MIAPGTAADWTMGTALLGTVLAFGAVGYRWILREELEAVPDAPPAFLPFEGARTSARDRATP